MPYSSTHSCWWKILCLPPWRYFGRHVPTSYWACRTDGLSHAHWIHSHKHFLPLSCMTACCLKAKEKLVCGCTFWRVQWWPHPQQVTWGLFFLDCTCSLGLCIFKDYAQVCVFGATTASFLLHCCHPCSPFGCIIFYTCTGVIVRGVDAPASAKGTSVNLCWVWATPSSLLIWPGLVAMVSVFCHNVSSPCCRTLWMKSFIFLFISGL